MKQTKEIAKELIERAKKKNIYLVIRFQTNKSRMLNVKNGKVDNSTLTKIQGVGIQAFTNEGYMGFSSVDTVIDRSRIIKCMNQSIKAAETAREEKFEQVNDIYKLKPTKGTEIQKIKYDPFNISTNEIESKVIHINKEISKLYPKYSTSNTVNFTNEHWNIFRSDGTNVSFSISNSLLVAIISIVEKNNVIDLFERVHGTGYEVLKNIKFKKKLLRLLKIKMQYIENLSKADKIEGGNYPLIIDGEMSGVFAHEAFGHTAESDSTYQKSPLLNKGKLRKDEKIANSFISISDYATKNDRGYYPFSSYGVKRKKVDIIKNGKINDLISDVITARKAAVRNNGGARTQSYSSMPLPRMSCTSIELDKRHTFPLEYNHLEKDIKEIHHSLVKIDLFKKFPEIIYLLGSTGGNVDSYEGHFQFASVVSFRMTKENISLIKPLSFSGSTLKVLESVLYAFGDPVDWPGFCGKSGQTAIVNSKAPMLFLKPNKNIYIG